MSHDSFENGCACIDGDYVPLSEARISLTDMGFLRCDATYDVVAVWKRKYFRLNDHFERFEASWQRLRMSPPLSRGEMREMLDECVRRIEVEDAYVAMILSRGMALPGVRDPRVMQNRFYAYATPYVWIVKPEDQEVGTHVVVCKETIRISNEAVDPKIKSFHWGDMVRGLFEAYDRGGYTAVLTDADGNITEGPGFNIFAYHNGVLLTPTTGVLEGITRRTVLELAEELGIEARPESVTAQVLTDSDEIFITSTAGGVMPVTTLDGEQVGSGWPGPITLQLRQRYWQAHDEERWATPVASPEDIRHERGFGAP